MRFLLESWALSGDSSQIYKLSRVQILWEEDCGGLDVSDDNIVIFKEDQGVEHAFDQFPGICVSSCSILEYIS